MQAARALLGPLADEGTPREAAALRAMRAAHRFRAALTKIIVVTTGDISRPPLTFDVPGSVVKPGAHVDAVVCPSHPGLCDSGMPGAQHAVHVRAGPQLEDHIVTRWPEVNHDGGVPFGSAQTTPAFGIPAKKIVHAIGPMRGMPPAFDDKLRLTALTYQNVFNAVDREGLCTVACTALGTGLAGVPAAASARMCMQAIATWLAAHLRADGLAWAASKQVMLVCFDAPVGDAHHVARVALLRACLRPAWDAAAREALVRSGSADEDPQCTVQ